MAPTPTKKSRNVQSATYLDPYVDHVDSHPHELTVAEIKRRYKAIFVDRKEPDSLAALAGLSLCILFGILVTVFGPTKADLQPTEEELKMISSGDTAWVLACSGLVLLMTPGLALFYGGMVQSKNMLSTVLQSIICMGLISVLWIVIGFSLAFGDTCGGFIGNPKTFFFFRNVGYAPDPKFAPTIPLFVFSIFHMKFSIIVPAIVSGAFTERVKFGPYCLYVILFLIFIYCPMAHWVWHPDGFLRKWGVIDFAGGVPIETASGWAALAGSLVLRPTESHEEYDLKVANPNIVFVALGASLLWFGWLGFDGGSGLMADSIAAQSFLNTNTSGAVAMLVWLCMDKVRGIKPSVTGACVGAVVGLVAITPGCGYVSTGGAIMVGTLAAIAANLLCVLARSTNAFDDQLEVFPAHGVTGTIGLILTGLFADNAVNPTIENGLFYGGHHTFYKNIVGAIFAAFYACAMSFILWKSLDLMFDIHVTPEQSQVGLDYSIHGEYSYKDNIQKKLKTLEEAEVEMTGHSIDEIKDDA